jgi:tetratricopeptide (TPR) repeat protein
MRIKFYESMMLISLIFTSILFSCAAPQQEIIESTILNSNKAIELNPKDSVAYNNRGSAYSLKGKYDLAISDLTKALEIDPKYGSAYYNRGRTFCVMKQYDKAISDLSKALEIDPGQVLAAPAYNERGIAYAEKGQYDLALSDFNKAIEINPNFSNARNNRERLLRRYKK